MIKFKQRWNWLKLDAGISLEEDQSFFWPLENIFCNSKFILIVYHLTVCMLLVYLRASHFGCCICRDEENAAGRHDACVSLTFLQSEILLKVYNEFILPWHLLMQNLKKENNLNLVSLAFCDQDYRGWRTCRQSVNASICHIVSTFSSVVYGFVNYHFRTCFHSAHPTRWAESISGIGVCVCVCVSVITSNMIIISARRPHRPL